MGQTFYIKSNFSLAQQDTQGIFNGYASIFDLPDHHNDVVQQGAFSKSLHFWRQLNRWPKMLWQHDPKTPIGFWTKMDEDGAGLFVEGKLLLELPKAREIYTLMEAGIVDSLSIGFTIHESIIDEQTDCRLLQQIHLCEVSLVTFGANEKAKVQEVKTNRRDDQYEQDHRHLSWEGALMARTTLLLDRLKSMS